MLLKDAAAHKGYWINILSLCFLLLNPHTNHLFLPQTETKYPDSKSLTMESTHKQQVLISSESQQPVRHWASATTTGTQIGIVVTSHIFGWNWNNLNARWTHSNPSDATLALYIKAGYVLEMHIFTVGVHTYVGKVKIGLTMAGIRYYPRCDPSVQYLSDKMNHINSSSGVITTLYPCATSFNQGL